MLVLGDADPCWSVCNWISFLNISSSLLGLANHLFSLSVPAGPSYYEFLFLSSSHPASAMTKLIQKKQSGISDISIPKWTLSLSAPEALFSLHELVTWLQFSCSRFVFGGLDLTGIGWHVLMSYDRGSASPGRAAVSAWGSLSCPGMRPYRHLIFTFPGGHVRVL